MANPLKRQHISDIGEFLINFDATHSKKSLSQQKEIDKYQRIARLRDQVDAVSLEKSVGCEQKKDIWEDF